MSIETDIIIIGAGIAGASAAYELSKSYKVVILEREEQPAYHSTGRSAATYIDSYGPDAVRRLTLASWPFLNAPAPGFSEHVLLSPRGLLHLGNTQQLDEVQAVFDELRAGGHAAEYCDVDAVQQHVPSLRRECIGGGVWESRAFDIDVHALLMGYLNGARQRGAQLKCKVEVDTMQYRAGRWQVTARDSSWSAPIVINAAGAWADHLARLAKVQPLGLVPKRRTAVLIDPPEGVDVSQWPLVDGLGEMYYFKGDAGQLLLSCADATPSEPCDAQPEELDVAIAVDRVSQVLDFEITRVAHTWAGLRTFASDGVLVNGFDAQAEGFYWLAGQGGYGIQTSSAMAQLARATIEKSELPKDLQDAKLEPADYLPARFS